MFNILRNSKFNFEVSRSHFKKGNMINHMILSAPNVNTDQLFVRLKNFLPRVLIDKVFWNVMSDLIDNSLTVKTTVGFRGYSVWLMAQPSSGP